MVMNGFCVSFILGLISTQLFVINFKVINHKSANFIENVIEDKIRYKLMVSLKLQNATINYELFHSHNYVPERIIVSIVRMQLFPRLPVPGLVLLFNDGEPEVCLCRCAWKRWNLYP